MVKIPDSMVIWIRRLMGSTNQADSSCIYFRISSNDLDFTFLSPPLVAGSQKYKHKIGHKYFTFQRPKKLGAFKITVIFKVKCFLKIEAFGGHEVLELHFKCSKNSISWNTRAPTYPFFNKELKFLVQNFYAFFF